MRGAGNDKTVDLKRTTSSISIQQTSLPRYKDGYIYLSICVDKISIFFQSFLATIIYVISLQYSKREIIEYIKEASNIVCF